MLFFYPFNNVRESIPVFEWKTNKRMIFYPGIGLLVSLGGSVEFSVPYYSLQKDETLGRHRNCKREN